MSRDALNVVVGSLSPIKARAVEDAVSRMFPGTLINLQSIRVASDVSDQPKSDLETFQGAVNRANGARLAVPEADLWVGIEGGIEEMSVGMAAYAWVAVFSLARDGYGRTATFFLPEKIAELVRGGKELGEASKKVLGM